MMGRTGLGGFRNSKTLNLGSKIPVTNSRAVVPVVTFSAINRGFSSTKIAKQIDRQYIQSLISKREPFRSNPPEFYMNEKVYEADIEQIWLKSWLFAGFTFQIPKPGSYLNYSVGKESLLVVRGEDSQIRAFFNVCRHRGSRLCSEESGSRSKFVCGYHGWTYGLDGSLQKANYMGEGFKLSDYPLHKGHVRDVGGLMFVSFADNPPDFDEAYNTIFPEIAPHGFDKAKIAHVENYDIHANWKLVYENNRECYHCNIAHPEYIRSNYDTSFIYQGPGYHGPRVIDPKNPKKQEIERRMDEENKRWRDLGLHSSPDSAFPGAGWYRASRTPLREGWVTESIDGQPVCLKLMGDFKDREMGSCRVHTLPNFWIHASSDHAVATRLTPAGPYLTKAQVSWIVHKDAVQDKDYQVEKILPFWKLTSEQDWKLCEDNQIGVLSSKYKPGPLSESKEAGLEKFIHWYLNKLQME